MKKLTTVRPHNFAQRFQTGLLATCGMALSSPVLAAGGVNTAMTKANTIMGAVSSGLVGIGVACVTIALMFVGFKMIFRAGQWADLAPVFWGGLLIGGAAALAGGLLGGG